MTPTRRARPRTSRRLSRGDRGWGGAGTAPRAASTPPRSAARPLRRSHPEGARASWPRRSARSPRACRVARRARSARAAGLARRRPREPRRHVEVGFLVHLGDGVAPRPDRGLCAAARPAPREQAAGERAPRQDPDALVEAERNHLSLLFSVDEVVVVLHGHEARRAGCPGGVLGLG